MGLFSSKTKYYVASSSFPIFDDKNRINQYAAAMLDYTANSQIEHSEYMKSYYKGSRLRNYQGLLNWWRTRGYFDTFGSINARFYGDASLNNEAIAEAIKQHVNLEPGDTFRVYDAQLSFFSEDFWIKHLATQQGKADWVLQNNDLNYEIDYPTDTTIRANFSDGRVIEGVLPSYSFGTRFLNISWSIIREKESTEVVPPVIDEETGEIIEDETEVTTTTFQYIYGYYCYQQYSGNSTLDEIMNSTNTGIEDEYTFFPVVPLRSGTSWFNDEPRRTKIIEALDYLQIFGQKDGEEGDSYKRLQDACVEGMTDGDIGDVDYITMLLGVSIGTTHPSDLRYMYEFWFNVHTNYRLRNGETPEEVYTAKEVDNGTGAWKTYINNALTVIQSNQTESNFVINCAASNLSYTYEWDGSEYFETNGKFKPDAKPGDYGVLSGAFTHTWTTREPKRDSEGNVETVCNEGECHIVYETVEHSVDYSLTFFCRQVSVNRWRFVAFVNLGLINLIYHGKTIYTSAHSGVMDAAGKATVTHTFDQDFPSAPGIYYSFKLNYITEAADGTNAFVVPLELNTFREVGIVNQLEISYGSQFLIFNCWVKKKIKWYQQGFFSVFVSFVGLGLSTIVMAIAPTIGHIVNLFFSAAFAVTLTAVALETALKVLQGIFGERLGTAIYTVLKTIFTTVICKVVGAIPVFGWAIAAAIMFTITAAEALNAGMSLKDAFLRGAIAGASMGVASVASSYISSAISSIGIEAGSTLGTAITTGSQAMISSTTNALLTGEDFGDALVSGLTSGVMAGIGTGLALTITENLGLDKLTNMIKGTQDPETAVEGKSEWNFKDAFSTVMQGEILENPFTYVNLVKMTVDEINYHKMANLENDFQEFADAYKSALNVLEIMYQQQNSLATAEFVCKLQANTGRLLTQFPEMLGDLTPDNFISMSLSTGSDFCNGILQSVSNFVEGKLEMTGYTPEHLYYNQEYASLIS